MTIFSSRPRGIPSAVRIGLSLGLLLLLLYMLDIREIGMVLAGASPLLLLLLLVVVYSERIYSALRWYHVLRWNGSRVPLPAVVRITFISAFAGLFLPGIVGTEAFRIAGLARYSKDLAMAFSSVLIDRMLAVITLVPFVLIGVWFAPPGMPEGIRATALFALALVLVTAFMILHSAPRRLLAQVMPGPVAVRIGPRLDRLYSALDVYRTRPGMLGWAILLAIGFQVLRVVVVAVSAAAVGVHLPIAYFFIFAPIIAMLSMAPISFAGVGIREATYVYLFSLVGIAAEQAFAASVLVQIIGLLSCLPGAWLYARGARTRLQAQEGERCVRSSPGQPVS